LDKNISIVIPTLNAETFLQSLIQNINNQHDSKPREIIIIDSSSTDNTVNLARKLGCIVLVIDRRTFDHGGTRNLGARLASGEIIVFMTQDAIPRNEIFLKKLTEPLTDRSIAASFGRQVARTDANPIERFTREFNYPPKTIIKGKENIPDLGIKTFFFSDVCSAFRKDIFEETGRYPEKIIMNEDMIIAAKLVLAGHKIAYVSDAEVWHSHTYTAVQQFKRNFDIGVSHNQNRWLLEYTRAEREGYKYVQELLAYLLHHGYTNLIPSAIGLTLAKYGGYKMGMMENIIPLGIKKRMSMHHGFWEVN